MTVLSLHIPSNVAEKNGLIFRYIVKIMAKSSFRAVKETDVKLPSDGKLDFDDDNLRGEETNFNLTSQMSVSHRFKFC